MLVVLIGLLSTNKNVKDVVKKDYLKTDAR